MKAVLIKEFNKDFSIEEVETPKPRHDEALVKVKAACLCLADVKIRNGLMPSLKLPHIPGHEVAGEVVEVGKNVKQVKTGDRVVVYMYDVCRDCYACREGRENLCVNIVRLGFERPGGHAEFVAVPEDQLLLLPDNLSFEEGAAIPDAISTMLHTIRDQAQAKINDYVVILGVGGLGMHGVQIARLCGGRVIAVARSEKKLEISKRFGAEWAFNGNDEKLAGRIIEVTQGRGAEIVIDLVGNPKTIQTSLMALKKGGTLVIVGSAVPELAFPAGSLMFKELTIKGTIGMKKQTMIDAIDLCRAGKIRPYVTDRFSLEQINEAARAIKESRFLGRSVIIP
jgi:propanol-preferring alcohol dehydrogenase